MSRHQNTLILTPLALLPLFLAQSVKAEGGDGNAASWKEPVILIAGLSFIALMCIICNHYNTTNRQPDQENAFTNRHLQQQEDFRHYLSHLRISGRSRGCPSARENWADPLLPSSALKRTVRYAPDAEPEGSTSARPSKIAP